MDSLKAQLSRYILKRRLEGGEFLYVYRPRGQSVAGKKAVWTILKSDGKIFSKLREASNVDNDEDFENLALKTIPLLPYEDSLSPDTNGDTKEEVGSNDEECRPQSRCQWSIFSVLGIVAADGGRLCRDVVRTVLDSLGNILSLAQLQTSAPETSELSSQLWLIGSVLGWLIALK